MSTTQCECSLNPQKKRGKCGACAESSGERNPPPNNPPIGAPDPGSEGTGKCTSSAGIWCPDFKQCDLTGGPTVAVPAQSFNSIAYANSDGTGSLFAVDRSYVWYSCDGGKSWAFFRPPLIDEDKKREIVAIAVGSEDVGGEEKYAAFVIGGGAVYESSGLGQYPYLWEVAGTVGSEKPPTTLEWSSITVSGNGRTVAALPQRMKPSENDEKYTAYLWIKDRNRGDYSWRETVLGDTFTTDAFLNDIASNSDGTKLVVCGRGGFLYASSDSGKTWELGWNKVSPYPFGSNLLSIAMSSDGTKLAVVEKEGFIWTGDSGGTGAPGISWTKRSVKPCCGRDWTAIAMSDDGTKLAATTSDDGIYTSSDSGETWTQTYPSDPQPKMAFKGIASSSDGKRLAAIADTGFWRSTVASSPPLSTGSGGKAVAPPCDPPTGEGFASRPPRGTARASSAMSDGSVGEQTGTNGTAPLSGGPNRRDPEQGWCTLGCTRRLPTI